MKDRIVHPKCSEFVFNALGGTGNENMRRTTYRDAGHECWGKAYNNLDLYTWLLKHSQKKIAERWKRTVKGAQRWYMHSEEVARCVSHYGTIPYS